MVLQHPSAPAVTNYGPLGNTKANVLRTQPPERHNYKMAVLFSVLSALAEKAGIPYINIPPSAPQAQELVTFNMAASPFSALERVMQQKGIRMDYIDGVWHMRIKDANLERVQKIEDENELVGVAYQLRFDPADRVAFDSSGGGGGGGGQSGMANQSTSVNVFAGGNSGSGGGSGGSGGGASSPNLPLQNSQLVFAARAPKIVNDIRTILGLRPLVYNSDGSVTDPEVEVAAGAQAQRSPLLPFDGSLPIGAAGGGAQQATSTRSAEVDTASLLPVYVPPQRPQVIYNSDSNLIWVVATRKQHRWVAEYLSRVDKPQDLIAIEVKFLETKKNPQFDLGINWANTLGSGITVRGSANAGILGEYNFGFGRTNAWGQTNFSSSSGGSSVLNAISNAIINSQTNLTITDIINSSLQSASGNGNISTNFSGSGRNSSNIDFRGQRTAVPYEAVLSLDQVSVTLQAFMQDRDSSVVQYPRVLTINNREVAITSAENTPVNAGVQQTQTGSVATQTGTLGYLPIGTQINILPKTVGEEQIALTVAITISSIIGTIPINLGTGFNEYPITTERVYNASLQVKSGYTLAVGGLEKVDDRDTQGGVPLLKDIPGLGYFFKNKSKARNRTNLIIFITPYLISDVAKTPGISENPEAVIPLRPGDPSQAPTFTPDGRIVGGQLGIDNAFRWLNFQLRFFRQLNIDNMVDNASLEKLRGIISVARVLLADLQIAAGSPPYDPSTAEGEKVFRAEALLLDLNKLLADSQDNIL